VQINRFRLGLGRVGLGPIGLPGTFPIVFNNNLKISSIFCPDLALASIKGSGKLSA